MLTTEQVAKRLGLKPTTVYAYVSRGLLTSHRNADGKGSLFDEAEVARFAAGRSLTPPPIETGISLIRDGRLYYRGHDAAVLATTTPFESVVTLLWSGSVPEPVDAPDTEALNPAASRRRTPTARGADRPGSAARLRHTSTARDADWPDSAAPQARPFAYPPLIAPPELVALVRAVTESLPAAARLTDRLRVATAAAAAGDPLRFDITPAAVVQTGQALLSTMAQALPLVGADPATSGPPSGLGSPPGVFALDRAYPESLAASLWPRLTTLPSTSERLTVLNAALVLLADHDIAASTLAARVAASTRAHPYAVVSAGLAVLDGPLHGAASGLAYELLADALRDNDPIRALARFMQSGRPVPGFGHPLYPDGDPRAIALLGLILRENEENSHDDALIRRADEGGSRDDALIRRGDEGGSRDDALIRRADEGGSRDDALIRRADEGGSRDDAEPRLAVIRGVLAAMARRSGPRPNIDFALAAFALVSDMPADAGEAIFAIARTAGWIAHALEEYTDRPLRFRPNGRYAGPEPG